MALVICNKAVKWDIQLSQRLNLSEKILKIWAVSMEKTSWNYKKLAANALKTAPYKAIQNSTSNSWSGWK